jgi:alkylhydroperoxidase family enzyme
MTAAEPWRREAPEAFAAFDRVEAIARGSLDEALLVPVQAAVARLLRQPVDGGDALLLERAESDPRVSTCVRFAEQFVVDVAGIGDADRAALSGALGADSFTFVQVVFVVDVFQRARIALERLHGLSYVAPPAVEPGDLWTALEDFMRVVAREGALDPVTTELVRLRGAALHQCRLCQSRLSVRALDAAGDSAPFVAIDDFERSALDPRQKAALRLTDAVLTQPAEIDDPLVAAVHRSFTGAESTEIVLDVVRNAANKIAVAFAADAPQVTTGIEFFDIDANGDVFADVEAAEVRRATQA